MLLYTALIYDGKQQMLVSEHAEDEDTFLSLLEARFGVFVCLWKAVVKNG